MKAGSISRYTAPISVEPAEVPVGGRVANPPPEPARAIAAIGRTGGDQRSQAPPEPALLTYLLSHACPPSRVLIHLAPRARGWRRGNSSHRGNRDRNR